MPKHAVTVSAPTLSIGKADFVFSVEKDSKKLGELRLSSGAAVWYPAGASYGNRLTWSKLASLFKKSGTDRAETKKRTKTES